ncbi:MAG TPA: TauD/TfdA family dioxygenase [Beijerinckiaceae bacterium]|jgi:alpha-ketoglutarate-dependent taurine dioxygenase
MTIPDTHRHAPVFPRMERRPQRVSGISLARFEPLGPPGSRPTIARAMIPNVSAQEWFTANRAELEAMLLKHGALLLRGFAKNDVGGFESFVEASAGPLMEYDNRSTPRSRVAGRVFTSTEYPSDQSIPQHNEMSYTDSWPRRLCFGCLVAPAVGGQTPIADSARVLARIPAQVRDRFERHGVMYVRNYGHGIDLPWQEVFQTDDPTAVDRFCSEHGIVAEWLPQGRLRTRQVAQATLTHPATGEAVWFNQAHLFHVSALPSDIADELMAQFAPDELPRTALYGDGTPIDADALQAVRDAYSAEEIVFDWEEGDLLLMDNVLVSHGRRPFSGARRIVVGMA